MRDYLTELGVRRIINGAGTYTMFTGSLMHPKVVDAIAAMSRNYVRLDELHDAVGRRIARLLACEAAMVTSGAFGALTLGTGACIAGSDPVKIRRLPETTGMREQVIIQRTHRFPYDHAVRNCGVRLIEVESRDDLERAVNDRTAMLLFLNEAEPSGQISAEEFVEIGKRRGSRPSTTPRRMSPRRTTSSGSPGSGSTSWHSRGAKGFRAPKAQGCCWAGAS